MQRSQFDEIIASRMSERELDERVRHIALELGMYPYHTRDSRGSEPGFPDWVLVGCGGILFREDKSERGELTLEQRHCLNRLALAGGDAGVWRPSDYLSGRIQRELAAIARPPGADA